MQRHAVVRKRVEPRFDGGETPARADFRTFAREQVLCDIHEVVGDPGAVELRVGAQNGGNLTRLLFPVARAPVGLEPGLDGNYRRLAGEIGDLGLTGQAAQVGALAREGFHGFLEGLVGGNPEVLAQRIVIPVDAHTARRADEAAKAFIADEI